MRIVDVTTTPSGYRVRVETLGAFTDGLPRLDDIHVPREALQGRTREERIAAIKDAVADRQRDLRNVDLDAPLTETKAVWERRAERAYAVWQRWQLTRIEAQARAMSAPVITALTNRENDAWSEYATILNAWRNA